VPKANPNIDYTKPVVVSPSLEASSRLSDQRIDPLVANTFKYIREKEGFSSTPYTDTKNKWTIGIGTLIGKGTEEDLRKSEFYGKQIDENTAAQIARKDLQAKADLMRQPDQLGKVVDSFSPELQAKLLSGYYRGDISGSPKAKAALNARKFKQAANQFLDNDEYRAAKASKSGVAKRMEELAEAIRNEGKPKKQPTFTEIVDARISNETL
jgi:GH24 family phage-related lysozyme (muramidase)